MAEISIKDRLELMNVLPSEACGEVFTRADVATNVLKLLKAKPGVFSNPNYRFLDIYTKSGVFLLLIYSELMQGLVEAIPDPEIRSQHILGKMIYGVSPSVETALISRKTLYGDWSIQGNIKVIVGYKNDTGKRTFSNVSKEFNGMKFDVVIGNPPYNKGMDLDFVNLGFELSSKYCCMITPAKWQTAEANQRVSSKMTYGEFRKKLVPHMSHVVFYPDCSDVFNIGQIDGITYFLIDKEMHDECNVKNISRLQKWFNSENNRNITDGQTLLNIGYDIITFLGEYEKYKISANKKDGAYKYWVNQLFSLGGGSPWDRVLLTQDGKCKIIGAGYIVKDATDYRAGVSECIFSSDDKAECESFVSWINTKFTRFFLICNVSKLTTTFDNTYFRFVPAPPSGKFDHIYTDQELYDAFNLPQKYRDVIEAVVKERK